MNLAIILFLGGAVIIAWIYLWSRQQMRQSRVLDIDRMMQAVPAASSADAVLVSQEQGRFIYINEAARRWLDLNGGQPHLEQIARLAEPADSFLELLAGERQTSFQLGRRWVEASSHRIPNGAETHTVIVLRELTADKASGAVLDMNLAMTLINEIGETVNASMGVEQVLQSLMLIVGRAIPMDAGEICLWNEEEQALYPRGWVGDAAYVIALAEAGGRYELGEGITGWIARKRQPVLLSGREEYAGIRPKLPDNPYESIVAVPLRLGERFVGTLEAASMEAGRFAQSDLALLQALSTPVAIAIYNAEIYADQVQRIDDLTGLQAAVEQETQRDIPNISAIYETLNARIAGLLSADMCGIFLYDTDRAGLAPVTPFHGLPEALVRTLFVSLPEDSPQRDVWENQPYWISNDVSDEPLVEALGMRPVIDVAGVTNTAWMPLQISGQRIGVMVVSNKRTEGGFTSRDIQNLTLLASQAAVIIENLRLYERERRMDTELIGLQEITNAIGTLSHETEFFGEITERIARLMEIEICGILIYEADAQRLASRLPFYGVEADLIADYAIPLRSGSIMEELWNEERYWYSNRVQTDPLVYEAGLDELAEKIGVKKTLMATLNAGDRRLGAIQISNKLSGEDFTDGDARLLMIFATQVAAIIENSRLFRQAQKSAEQAQGLRRVAELAGNVLTTQETFTPVLAEIARVMRCEIVFVNVLNQQTGSLVTYPRWVHGAELSEPYVQDIYAPGFEYSVAVSHRPYLGNDVLNDERVLPSYRQISERMNITRAVLVPLIFGERTLGELGIANRRDGPFTDEDLQVIQVIAAQAAAALDRLLLYEATGQNLNRRLEELDSISRVSNELALTLDLDHILDTIREEAVKATRADGSTVVLLTPAEQWKAPDQPEVERRLGEIGGAGALAAIEQEAISRGADAVLIPDYEFSAAVPAPDEARSAVAVAIVYLDQIVGVLHLYHNEPNQFDDRASAFLTTMAVKASLGYGNAIRYREQLDRSDRLRRRVEQLNRIFELGHMFQSNTEIAPANILEAIAYSVQQSVGFDTVVMTLVDEQAGVLRRVAHAGLPLDVFEQTRAEVVSLEQLDALLTDEYRISESYFFPVERVSGWHVEGIGALSTSYAGNRTIQPVGAGGWRDGDMLLVALLGAAGDLIGLMSLDRPHDNRRPDRGTIEVLEIFAHQAASTIENTRLYTSSKRSAEQEARLNEVMEAISRTLDVADIVQAMAAGMYRLAPFARMTMALADDEGAGFELLRVSIEEDGEARLSRQHQPTLNDSILYQAHADGQDLVYCPQDAAGADYADLREWHQSGEEISLILPLRTGGTSLGAVHLGGDGQQAAELLEARPLLRRMAQMVASAIQNARLFNQAVNLRVLNESVVESIQQGIVVLDDAERIISVNGFMYQRYNWDPACIGQALFKYRAHLAELMRPNLRTTLEQGIPQELINQIASDKDGSLLVSNYYLYPLRSGETVRGAVLLVEDVTERARLEQAMEARANQLAALTEVSSRITSSLEREEVVQLAIEEMGWLIPYDTMSLWRRNGAFMVLEGSADDLYQPDPKAPVRFRFVEHPLTHQVVDTQRVVVMGDADEYPAELPIQQGVSWMGVPLVNQGHVVGMMMLVSNEAQAFGGRSDQNIAFAFASQVAIALANADLFEQTFDRTNELGTLLEAAQATSLTTDLDSVFRTVVELMFGALDMDRCAIMIYNDVDNQLEVQLATNRQGDPSSELPRGTRLDVANYPARRRALRDRDVVLIMRDDAENPYVEEIEELRQHGDTARMLVPLVVREQSIGLIQLEQTRDDEPVSQQKVRLARALGAQVAVAIENARLSAETTAHFEESLIINDLSQAISSTLDLNDMMSVVRDQVPGVAGAGELYLALYETKTEEITFPLAVRDGQDYQIPPRKLGSDEVSFIIKHRRPLSLGADYWSPDELRASLGITNGEGDVKSYMGVPLMAGDQVYGVLAVRDTRRTRAFTLNEQRILTTVGSQLGAAIQNARLFDQISTFADDLNWQVAERTRELQEERDRLDTLYQITSELARTLDMDRLMPRALGMVAKAVGAQDGVIMQLDPKTDQLYSRAVLNPKSLVQLPDSDHVVHPAEHVARWLIEEDESIVLVDDLHEVDYWDKDAPGAAGWRSALAVLLETNEELLGVMVLLSKKPDIFMESHLRLMVAAANQVAASINNAELYKLIREQAERLGALLRTEQEEAEKSKAILEGIADGVILSDAEGSIILFNTAAERILDVPREGAMGASLAELTGLYGGSAATWTQSLEKRLEDSAEDATTEFLDERIEIGDRVVSVHLSPVYTSGRFLGTVSVLRDITRDVEVDRAKSVFVANVSHEFRTPLTSIKGYTDLLLLGAAGEVSDKQRDVLNTVRDNVARLTGLVEDVLSISQIDAGRARMKISDVDLKELIERVLKNLISRPNHLEKDFNVIFEPPELSPVQADYDKLMRVLSNIIDNAFNYTRSGGTIEITTQLEADQKRMLIAVRDTGVGIPEDAHERIWRRFERHDETTLSLDVAGTGLGLPIVKELVQMHGGEVRFESVVGEGTTFFITLPVTQPQITPGIADIAAGNRSN
jgi:PAS domain S-box-containing protein